MSQTTTAYGNVHRKFLQGMMCRKICNGSEVKELFQLCCEEGQEEDFGTAIVSLIQTINRAIMPFRMEIRKGVDEEDGTQFYAIVNCYEGPLSLAALNYNNVELEFFQKLIEVIVQSDNGVISSIAALNIMDDLSKPMSKYDGQNLLKRLVEGKWIIEKGGKISLSALTIMEFTQYIKEMFPDDITSCHLCKQLVLKGKNCIQCDAKLHSHCISRLFKNKERQSCPVCNALWSRGDSSISQPGTSQGKTRKKSQNTKENKKPR